MGQRDAIRHYIREHFNEALQKGFLKVYYQPVIRTLTGKICGVEALSRWESPTHGRLSPADFIPVLEETHLIHKLDAYVIDRVCHHLRQRIDDGRPSLPVSLNLSRLDFTLANPRHSWTPASLRIPPTRNVNVTSSTATSQPPATTATPHS